MSTALIGYTGFVGSTLLRQTDFDALFNSKNIREISGATFDLIVCAGAPAEKWKANAQPEADKANLATLMDALSSCTAGRIVLISTVDVYAVPQAVYEDSFIDVSTLGPYGRHRYELEQCVAGQFKRARIVRLPALFGAGLRKNLIFDLLHLRNLDWTDWRCWFQFYDMSRLWCDLTRVLESEQPVVNFATAPVSVSDVTTRCFGLEYKTQRDQPPARYDMRTRFAPLFGGRGDYLYDAEETLLRLSDFVIAERARIDNP